MLKLLLGLAGAHSTSSNHCASECSTDAELDVYPRLMATAFIPRHLPDRVFFLTSNLLVIRRLLQSTNLCMYDHDLTFVPDSEWVSGVDALGFPPNDTILSRQNSPIWQLLG